MAWLKEEFNESFQQITAYRLLLCVLFLWLLVFLELLLRIKHFDPMFLHWND